jgi:hypothetical protein
MVLMFLGSYYIVAIANLTALYLQLVFQILHQDDGGGLARGQHVGLQGLPGNLVGPKRYLSGEGQ